MTEKRSDTEMVARLMERLKLVVAVSDDIATQKKLHIQPMIQELAELLAGPENDQDTGRVAAYFESLLESSDDDPNATALLGAVRNFVTYL